MRTLEEIDALVASPSGASSMQFADELLTAAEEILENWLIARGQAPTRTQWEGFRLLALHRQGAKGDPSFNACRETCRELVYRRNLIAAADDPAQIVMMRFVLNHLLLFIRGKMEVAGLGEFCCSSRPLRTKMA